MKKISSKKARIYAIACVMARIGHGDVPPGGYESDPGILYGVELPNEGRARACVPSRRWCIRLASGVVSSSRNARGRAISHHHVCDLCECGDTQVRFRWLERALLKAHGTARYARATLTALPQLLPTRELTNPTPSFADSLPAEGV